MSKKKNQKKDVLPQKQEPVTAAAPEKQVPASPPPRPKPARTPLGPTPKNKWGWAILALVLVYFLVVCLSIQASIKTLAMGMLVVTIVSCFLRIFTLRERLSLPMAAVALWVLMNGISTSYALSGKFALREFLKLIVGFCCFLLILAWSRKGKDAARTGAVLVEGAAGLAGILSIDMISTHWLSGPVLSFLQNFSSDYEYIANNPIEAGVRINSIFDNPNIFAGVVGLGVLVALGLAVTARGRGERRFHLVCLFWSALSFVLAFSMGASGMICLAFLVLLILERKDRKAELLILMVETLALTLLCAFPIFLTSFGAWTKLQPVPLVCALGGAALLCLVDQFVGQRLSAAVQARSGKVLAVIAGVIVALLAVFAALAVNTTGPAHMAAGSSLRRAEYPAPGAYTLEVQATGALNVTIESQDQRETMMHTSTVIYSGAAQGAAFTVPEDSLVVYFNFGAPAETTVESVRYQGNGGEGSLKLNYKLLPGFIANRLQGLFANENAIQRVVFFSDGMKLFRRSPVVGLGMGAFENAVRSVQSFYYNTKYTHNHYIETLITTGVVGLVLFVGVLGLCAAAVLKNLRKKEEAEPLAPALGAALVFMIGHAAVEVVFSSSFYLVLAMSVLGLICLACGDELPLLRKKEEVGGWLVAVTAVLLIIFSILLSLNISMRQKAETGNYEDMFTYLETASKLDKFEWSDYLLSYVNQARELDLSRRPDIFEKANEFAAKLGELDSNSLPPHLARYYFSTDQREEGMAMLEKLVDYIPSDSASWQSAFDILAEYSEDTPEHRREVEKLYQQFQDWNAGNMGAVTLSEANMAYITAVLQ